MARHAARVFAALVRAADDDVFDLFSFEFAACEHRLDCAGKEVIGAHFGEAAGIAAERGTLSIVNIGVEHMSSLAFIDQGSVVRAETPSLARRVSQMLGR